MNSLRENMFLLLSFAWQRTVLTTLKENNSYKRIILKSKSEMWKVIYLSPSIEIYIKIYSLLKCQHNLSSKEQSLFSQIRYGVFWSSSLLVLQSPCFEWDPCCPIFCLLCNVFSSFSLVLSVYLFGKLLVSPSFSWRNYL